MAQFEKPIDISPPIKWRFDVAKSFAETIELIKKATAEGQQSGLQVYMTSLQPSGTCIYARGSIDYFPFSVSRSGPPFNLPRYQPEHISGKIAAFYSNRTVDSSGPGIQSPEQIQMFNINRSDTINMHMDLAILRFKQNAQYVMNLSIDGCNKVAIPLNPLGDLLAGIGAPLQVDQQSDHAAYLFSFTYYSKPIIN